MRLSDGFAAFISVKTQEGYSPHTLSLYQIHARKLVDGIGDINAADVTLDILRTYLSTQTHLKMSSLASKVRAIKSMFKWLYEEEYIAKNPAIKLREPKQPQRVPKALSVDEVEMLRESCRTLREHALLELFFATGCRLDEIHRINISDIDWDRKAITVWGKGNRERECYFGAKARIWLQRYIASRKDDNPALFVTVHKPIRRMSKHRIWDVFKIVASRCGLHDKVSPHKWRHTLATLLLNQGAPLATVQSILGHSKPTTTMLYVSLTGTARQREYQKYFVQ